MVLHSFTLAANPLRNHWAASPAAPLDDLVNRLRDKGQPVIDLVGGSALEAGLGFPEDVLHEVTLAAIPKVREYTPVSFGQPVAREAIAGYYRRRGCVADVADILLTPGTSLGYLYALKLLTVPGDTILVPNPGYPLFDDLCALCGVEARQYHLRETVHGWEMDPEEVEFQVTPRTRAVAVVSPHNPTGHVASARELNGLAEVCRRRGLALLFDEVFCEHTTAPIPRPDDAGFPLALTLNGFSKMLSLPGWKLAWLRLQGTEPKHLQHLREALDHLADTFLPVNELIQAMAPLLLEHGEKEYFGRLALEVARRREMAAGELPNASDPGAGVYLLPRLREGTNDSTWAMDILSREGIHLHPGNYYGLRGRAVMTILGTEEMLMTGCRKIREFLAC